MNFTNETMTFGWYVRTRMLCAVALMSALVACGGGGGGGDPPASPAVPAAIAPTLTQQPANQSVVSGGTATFTVTVSGDAPLGYQWLRNGVAVNGATQGSQTVGPASVQDSGSRWSVRVTNGVGSITSAEAVLTVMAAPVPLGISLTAGTPSGRGYLDGKGRDAYFADLGGLAFDASGTAYVSETSSRTIRKITSDGTVTTIAGAPNVTGTQDGSGSQARFTAPRGLAVGPDGAFYVLDADRLRRVTTSGVVTTVAVPLSLNAVASAPDGTLYLATTSAVYRYEPGVGATLVAGIEGSCQAPRTVADCLASGSTDGAATSATFVGISGIAVDAARTVYVSQFLTHTLRRIGADGAVTTFAGSQNAPGSVDGQGAAARFDSPATLTLDAGGNLWVAELGRLRRVTPGGSVSTPYRGTPYGAYGGLNQSGFSTPLAFGPNGQLYFSAGSGISHIDAAGTVTPLAGHDFLTDPGLGVVAGLATDPDGNVVVATAQGGTGFQTATSIQLEKYTPAGERLPFRASVALPETASTAFPGLGADAQGNIYLSAAIVKSVFVNTDQPIGGTISKVAPDGSVSTVASWAAGSANALAPAFLRVGRDQALYFVDLIGNNLVKWTAAGGPVVLANLGPSQLLFGITPWEIAADASGKVYVARRGVVQRVDNGRLVTIAGALNEVGSVDGPGAQARFMSVAPAIVADAAGALYVADLDVVRKVAPDGTVTTVAGQRDSFGLRTGALPGSLGSVGAITIGADGLLHVIAQNALVEIRLP